MPQYEQPNPMPSWAEGDGALVSQPTPSQISSGYTQSERPTAQSINWLFRQLSRAYRFVSQGVNAVLIGSQQEFDFRLLGGGSWSWSASANTLAWSEPFQISMPGLADSVNTCAAGSVTLTAGQIACVSLNTPFATTGTLTSGSKTVTDLDFESGIVVGASVTGTAVQPGSTVASVSQSDNSITLSVAPTASGSKVRLVFATSGALSVSAADVSTFAPSNVTAVIARCIAGPQNHVIVGLNSGQFRLLDNEAKRLLAQGYVTTMRVTAGAALAARQPIYISPGAADGRTAGFAYPLDVSATATPVRAAFAGLAVSSVASGATVEIVMSGRVPGFSSLVPGATYYANPSSPSALQSSAPAVSGQFIVPVGAAVTGDTLVLSPSPSPVVQAVGSTTSFSGPISAPSVISAKGFRSRVDLGSYVNGSTVANGSEPFYHYAGTSRWDCNVPMMSSGSVTGMALNTFQAYGGGTIKFYKNNALVGTYISSGALNSRFDFGVKATGYTFVAGDVLSATYTSPRAGDSIFLRLWAEIELNA